MMSVVDYHRHIGAGLGPGVDACRSIAVVLLAALASASVEHHVYVIVRPGNRYASLSS
jgi:uncharacterized protein YjaG (DUF416 family)